jgi:hypothetical protein
VRLYVASTTLQEPLPWRNSTLLTGDVAEAVAELKRVPGGDLVILGSVIIASYAPASQASNVGPASVA